MGPERVTIKFIHCFRFIHLLAHLSKSRHLCEASSNSSTAGRGLVTTLAFQVVASPLRHKTDFQVEAPPLRRKIDWQMDGIIEKRRVIHIHAYV